MCPRVGPGAWFSALCLLGGDFCGNERQRLSGVSGGCGSCVQERMCPNHGMLVWVACALVQSSSPSRLVQVVAATGTTSLPATCKRASRGGERVCWGGDGGVPAQASAGLASRDPRSEPVRGRRRSREKGALLCSSFPGLGDGLGSAPPAPRRRGQFAYVWKDQIPEWPAPEALAKCPSGCSPLPAIPDVSPPPLSV